MLIQLSPLLKLSPLLQGASVIDMAPKRTIIAAPDQLLEYLYIVKSGYVEFYQTDETGKKIIQALYGPDDYFPVAPIVNATYSGFYIQTIEETVFQKVPARLFAAELKRDATLCSDVLGYIITQTALYKYRVDNISLVHSSERLAYRLLLSAARFGALCDGYIEIPMVSQENLGTLIGLSRESVSKGLKKLERSGTIAYNGDRLVVQNIRALLDELRHRPHLPPFFKELEAFQAA